MASTGAKFPTVAASVDRAGSTAWTNPGNVVSDNATDATSAVPTDYLVTSAYGFDVPGGATILGVTVKVEASETGSGASSYIPQLHSDTTPTLIGSAKSAVAVSGATKVISTNGGAADLWSATLTSGIVNSAGFGVSIWSTDTTNTLAIDYVTISIDYTPPLGAHSDFSPLLIREIKRRRVTRPTLVIPPSGSDTSVAVGTKAFTFATYDATITVDRNVDVASKALTFTTYPATITVDREVLVQSKAFTFTANPSNVTVDVNVNASTKAFTFATHSAEIAFDKNVDAASQPFTFTTYPATVAILADTGRSKDSTRWVIDSDRIQILEEDELLLKIIEKFLNDQGRV